jgi:hypothetical protein
MGGDGFHQLTLDTIKRLCGNTNFATGQTYFRAGRVHSLKREGAIVTSMVQGANFHSHRVKVEWSSAMPDSMECSCMQNSHWRECCKHIAATLFALLEELQVKDSSFMIQRMIANQLQHERRKDQDDAIMRGIILHYFGEPHLKAEVEYLGHGPGLKVTIMPEVADGLMMTLVIPAKRVPGFIEAVQGRENVTFKGAAQNLRVAKTDAELEPDEEGTTILRISGMIKKLSKDEVAQVKVSRDWVFHQDQFHPIRRKPRGA